MKKILLFVLFLLSLGAAEIDKRELSTDREKLVAELANGFVRATERESKVWWECGEQTPRDRWYPRAEMMARELLTAMDDYGSDFSPWGVWGVIWAESRGNRCAIGPNPRRYAASSKIVKVPDRYQLWTENDVKNLINNPKWGRRTADLGLGQVVWKRYARIPCERRADIYWNRFFQSAMPTASLTTGCRIESERMVRVPTLDEMISVDGGARVTAWGMIVRQNWSTKRNRTPWLYWKGLIADYRYLNMITNVVDSMGGPVRAVMGHK